MKKLNVFLSALIAVTFLITSCGGTNKNGDNNDANDSVKTIKTIENLKSAITGETTASAKYKAFSEKANDEGYDEIAGLFAATSKSESIHAANHMKALEKMDEKFEAKADSFEVRSTKENLEDAIKGESYEVDSMYPDFIKTATNDKADDAVKSFNWAMDTEKRHKEFYQKALDALQNNKVKGLSKNYLVCPKCGNTFTASDVSEACDFCGTGKEKFLEISWQSQDRK